jgi:phosphoribosyl 1,2-cyclic phosphodiesterase
MSEFCPLASGSKGNSIYFGSKEAKILIDAGISFAQLKLRLSQINVNIEEVEAILVTHEHTDHIAGLKVLSEKLNIPIFANSDTAKGIYNSLNFLPKFKVFTTSEEFEFKDLKILPFSIQHDTLDPVGFIIKTDDLKFGFCTDLGFVTTQVLKMLENCNYLYIEANHHVPMVHSSNRSFVYKQRVLSRQGHLSNNDCIKLLEKILHPNLKHIHFAHISEECNFKELIKDLIEDFLQKKNSKAEFSITYQDKISKKIIY